jgi:hypothetical protein
MSLDVAVDLNPSLQEGKEMAKPGIEPGTTLNLEGCAATALPSRLSGGGITHINSNTIITCI